MPEQGPLLEVQYTIIHVLLVQCIVLEVQYKFRQKKKLSHINDNGIIISIVTVARIKCSVNGRSVLVDINFLTIFCENNI